MGESVLMGACARTIVGITLLPFTVLKARFEVICLLVLQILSDRLSWATCTLKITTQKYLSQTFASLEMLLKCVHVVFVLCRVVFSSITACFMHSSQS